MTWLNVGQLLLVGAVSFAGNWAADKVERRYMRRDIDRAHARLDEHDKQFTELYRSM